MLCALAFLLGLAASVSGSVVDVHLKVKSPSNTNPYVACGATSRSSLLARSLRQGRIVKGNEAGESDAPFMASVQYQNTHICNGYVIHSRVVITSTQCYKGTVDATTFTATPNSDYKIVTGSRDLTSGVGTSVATFVAFPTSQLNSLLPAGVNAIGDWALFVTSAAITGYGTTVQPICLGQNIDMSGRTAFFAGWGTTTKSGTSRANENRLRTLQMKVLSKSTCSTLYYFNMKVTFSKRKVIDRISQCAKTNTFMGVPAEGPCEGDFGGPLYIDEESKKTAVSIFSNIGNNNNKCGQYLSPGIFTNINLFVDVTVAIVGAVEAGTSIEDVTTTEIPKLVTSLVGIVTAAIG